MKNNRTLGLAILSLLLFIGNAPLAAKVKNYTLSSPDGGLKVEISTGDGLSYRIMHENDTILSHSNTRNTLRRRDCMSLLRNGSVTRLC